MPVAIDTSVLVAAEKRGGIEQLLRPEEGPFYIPALGATEFWWAFILPCAMTCDIGPHHSTTAHFDVRIHRAGRGPACRSHCRTEVQAPANQALSRRHPPHTPRPTPPPARLPPPPRPPA